MSDTDSSTQRGPVEPPVSPGRWVLDPARSTVSIGTPTFWGLLKVKGVFSQVSGEGEVRADGSAHGTLTIDAASVNTKQAKRDTHLRSNDFFDVEKHPTLSFTASEVTAGADGTATVSGELTVRGTSKPYTFTARTSEVSADAVTLTAELVVARADFGMTWNQAGMIKPDTAVAITARFTRVAN